MIKNLKSNVSPINLLIAACLLLSGCGSTGALDDSSAKDDEGSQRSALMIAGEGFDEDQAREEAEEELASESYVDTNGTTSCIDDCSGHEAGWKRRAENGYSTDGKSQSFKEGGQAFDDALEERVDEKRSAAEDSTEDSE